MNKKVTIYEIAEELGVTVSTVSRALNNHPAISEVTKKAVLRIAEKLNYRPNKLASALKSGRSNIIGVIVPSIQSHFFASIIHSIEEELKASDYRIIVYQTKESVDSEINGVKTLMEAQVDGIMASLSLETDDVSHFEEFIKTKRPLILFDRTHTKLNVPTVTLDDFKAGYIATQHLIDKGYREIACITTLHQIGIFSERLKGYKAAMSDNGLTIKDDWIIFGGLSIKDGRFGAGKLMRSNFKPDAIIAGDDFTALGIIKKLGELQITPPNIGVIGFSNEVFSGYISPSLSTIDQHPNQMGSQSAKLFLSALSTSSKSFQKKIVITPSLVERESTAK